MFSKLALSALAAATVASAASCSADTLTITASSDAALATCTTFTGNIVVSEDAGTSVDLGSVEQIKGDLTVENMKSFISLTASDLNSITGTFTLQNLTSLSTLSMNSLTSVGTIIWQSLPALQTLTFSTGVQSAESVTISDTFLNTLDGISLQTVGTMDINNNGRLTEVDLALGNLTGELKLQANGLKLAVSLPNLVWAANLTIANVTTFSAPSLATINGSAYFDSNYFTEFSAPNLTKTASGSFSFINNGDMTTLNVPELATVGGGLTIVNNTVFQNLTLPKLSDVGGAVDCGGNFSNVEFGAIENVVGTFTITSSQDISDDCTALKEDAPKSQGGNGNIQGKFACTYNNPNANSGSSSGGTSSGSGSSNSSSAASLHINSAVAGLSFIGLLAQLL